MAQGPFVRLILAGTIQVSQGWSVGLSFSTDIAPAGPDLQTWLNSIVTATTTWWNASGGPGQLSAGDTTLSSLRAYSYAAGATKSSAEASITMALVGTPSRILPTQCSLVVSLRSGNSSRHGRGRIYLPVGGSVNITAGQYTSAACTALATATKTYLDALNASSIAPAVNHGLAVATGGSNPAIIVQGIQVNSKIDTQRRRTDKIGATFNSIQTL